VSDWVKALEGASPALKASDRVEYGDIDDPKDRAFFASISPINNAAKIRTPVLVQHGANDPRDPVTESDRLVSAIRQNGGEVVYLRFPDEGHGVVRRANRVHMYRRIAAFLEEKLGLGGGGAAQAGSRP
jgi:dipeptidyl aminopeptidase/acylaminoacyl peptidase